MATNITILSLNIEGISSRESLREFVTKTFLNEKAGTGTGELATRYWYIVKTLKDGRNIYLDRPTFSKKGFDFIICVSDTNFAPQGRRWRNYPSFDDIIDDLNIKKKNEYIEYAKLLENIESIFKLSPPKHSHLTFKFGKYDADIIQELIKWFFIEQDMCYWNYSGRNKLMNHILELEKTK